MITAQGKEAAGHPELNEYCYSFQSLVDAGRRVRRKPCSHHSGITGNPFAYRCAAIKRCSRSFTLLMSRKRQCESGTSLATLLFERSRGIVHIPFCRSRSAHRTLPTASRAAP